jgi:TfoX/Sxy family transcriptional regulator of competence genes
MKMPKAADKAVALFASLVPKQPGVSQRPVFGQPAAFLDGNMFLGVFGENLIVRLSESDRAQAALELGAKPFEPMPGRPMREYVVLPAKVLADPASAEAWVARALAFAHQLPKKVPKPRAAARRAT